MTLPYRLLAALLLGLALFVGGLVTGARYEKGQQARRDLAAQRETGRALVREIDNRDEARVQADNAARRASDGYQKELAAVRADRDAAVERLRIPATVCTAATAAAAEAPSTSRPDAAAPGAVTLPAELARNLFDLARRADEVTAQGRALQEWIRSNGFYGE